MTVSLLEILTAARAHAAPLAAESAGYLLLAVADHVLATPRVVRPEDVELQRDGSVRLVARRSAGADAEVEQAARRLLARALAVSSSVGPALRRAAERREEIGLAAFVRELEIALIPVNRSAAKRALSRLYRETERAKGTAKFRALLEAEEAEPAQVAAAPVSAPRIAEPPSVVPAVVEPDFPVTVDLLEPSPVHEAAPLPVVAASPPREPLPPVPPPVDLTPEPQLAVAEPALTKPEPVVQRAKERGSSTPRLGTLITLQTLPGEEADLTERAPAVALADEPQPFVDPEPSRMPDVLTAMLELHTGVDADEAPTRLRDVVTEPRLVAAPAVAPPVITPVSAAVILTPEPSLVEDEWLTQSSHPSAVGAPRLFVSEQADPVLHEALTWNPGPVAPARLTDAPQLPAGVLIAPPVPEVSYAPAVLPGPSSDVSELLDSFYVSDAADEQELRSALKGMAGLELTPMPHPYVEER